MSKKMDLIGLHCHIGTYMMTAKPYGIAATKLADLAVGLKQKYDHYIKYIDLGGGFASKNTLKGAYLPAEDTNPSFDEYAEAITTSLLNSNIHPEHLPTLILETGRALIDDAGYLLGTAIANKRNSIGKRTTVLDIGVNILFTSFWYEHKITPAQEFSHHVEDTTIYGPLCMSIDVIRENISLPPLNTGDNVVIHRVGAYNMTQWMQFITFRPNVVMISSQGDVNIIRKQESLESVNKNEAVPNHLKEFEL
jgi:diaminopimelate decarboxylase